MKMDENNFNHQMIIAAMGSMVDDEGLTPRQVFEVLEDIKRNVMPALMEMYSERVTE